jgi:PmbA protein
MRYEQVVKEVLGRFRKAGADAEVFLETRDELSIDVREGKLETLKQSASKGMGVRVLHKGRMSFVDSTDFSKGSIDSLVDKALSLAKVALEDEHNVFPTPQGERHEPAVYDPEVKKIPREEKMKMALDIEKKALAFDPLIERSEGCSYFDVEGEVIVANTLGVFEGHRGTYCQIRAGVVAEKGESRQPGEYETASRYFRDLMKVDEIARNLGYRAVSMVGGEKVKSQASPVVFDRVAGERLLNGLADALNGDDVALGRSFLVGRVGQKIAAESVTVIDDGIMDRGVASRPVDAEGVPTRKRTMVERGILKGYFYNARGASRAKSESTGNAFRWGYGATPGTGHHNFYMVRGTLTPEEIVKNTKSGLLVLQTIGFGVNSHSGGFSVGVSGVWIKDGKLAGPVVEVTVASDMLTMLQGVDAIGDDLIMDRGTACPTFRIREMTIGGA